MPHHRDNDPDSARSAREKRGSKQVRRRAPGHQWYRAEDPEELLEPDGTDEAGERDESGRDDA